MTEQKYFIRWKNRTDHFQKQLSDFIDHQILCDVTLVSEGQIFKAHQFILATSSSYFKNIFQEVPVSQHPIIFLRDVTTQEIKCLLDYIYKGETVVPKDLMPSFLKTCESLRVQELCEDQNRRSTSRINDERTMETSIPEAQVTDNISFAATQLPSQDNDFKIQVRKRQSENADGKFVQLKQSKTVYSCQNKLNSSTPIKDDGHSGRNQQNITPSSGDMTQIDLPIEETCLNNSLFNEDILDSPPRSPQSLIFPIVSPKKQINLASESVIIISEKNSEVLEISDDDSPTKVSNNQASRCDKIVAMENNGGEQIPDDSDGSVDDFQLSLSPDVFRAGDQDETDESEIVNTRNINRVQSRSSLFDNLNQLNPESSAVQQRNSPESNELNQQLKVVLIPLTVPLQNSTHKDVHQNDEDSSGSNSDDVDGPIYKSIRSVPAKFRKTYCKTCCKCIHPLFWKRHVRHHLKRSEQTIEARKKKAF